MKFIALMLIVFVFLSACSSQIKTPGRIGGVIGDCICTEEYAPVCGEDGKTYSNTCFADCAQVKFTDGEC